MSSTASSEGAEDRSSERDLPQPLPQEEAGSVSFVAYPSQGTLQPGPVASVRLELVALGELEGVRVLDDVPDAGRCRDVLAVVIDRSCPGSAELLTHAHSVTPAAAAYLATSGSLVLEQDAHLVQFAVSVLVPGGTAQRMLHHRRTTPLQSENAAMRAALGIPAHRRVTPSVAKAALSEITTKAVAQAAAQAPQRSQSPPRATPSTAPGILTGPAPLHSPLHWDMETEAAINARTKYDAFTQRRGTTRMRLDKVSQSQLVVRLHDKSMDSRRQRLAEQAEQLERELGKRERRTLSAMEEAELGSRLHDEQRERSKAIAAALRERFMPALSSKRLTKAQQRLMGTRLHDESMAHAKGGIEKLVEHYVAAHDPPKVKLEPAQQQDMADRLSSRKP